MILNKIKTTKLKTPGIRLGGNAKIDRLVYELYGLTKEEIKIVEGGN